MRLMSGTPAKNEPQMNADERRFIVPGLYWRGLADGAEGGAAPVEARVRERAGFYFGEGAGKTIWHNFSSFFDL